MAGARSWQGFEAVIARLEKVFAKQGNVTRNERIVGRISGRKREIDITIRASIGGEDVLLVVDCKQWNRKPDVKAVEAFAGLKKDVGANLGIMISTKGFSKAAHRTAEHEGIKLYRYEDTTRQGWPSGLETNLLIHVWELTPTDAHFLLADGTEEAIASDEGLNCIETKTGEESGVATVLRKIWDSYPSDRKREESWVASVECSKPGRPEIRKLCIGARSRLIRGYRRGRLVFEGLIDEWGHEAKTSGWKMIFDGDFIPLAEDAKPPRAQTLSLHLSRTHVRTSDPRTERAADLIYRGALEFSVQAPEVMKLPVRPV